ncbi:SapC family protein [Phenylobacterium deserti]|uniref:Peptide ABC transporter permease n=1 Tax=Phenylobacterium deserti TaxID=1914756 RepID=A0A328ABW6_9CAUL|nr:SapC family protein [Phenylobacterium deserti]RAK52232.1 peptide ABC transporter permease [Phenylobacterium deserti]
MTKLALLNNVDHADLRVIAGHGAEFGDNINQVLIFPTEFEEIQREYPIFFRRDAEGQLQSVALLGLDRDENLFLSPNGWTARYVPALQQRGPFSIALSSGAQADAEPQIHVDLDHPRISRTEGEPLFLKAGGNSPYLQHVARVLGSIYNGLEVSKPMFAAFEELQLIEAIDVEIALDDRVQYDVPGLFTIAQDRLAELAGEDLERLHKSGFLQVAYWVISSLGNVSRLIDLKTQKLAAA